MTGLAQLWCVALGCFSAAVPASALALEISGGVSVGGMMTGGQPRLAVSPHASVSWRADNGFALSLSDMVTLFPATNKDGVGVYNRTSSTIGFATQNADVVAGPSVSVYSMPSCRNFLCGRANGLAVGGHAQASLFLLGPLGLSVSASLDWIAGGSLVISEGFALMVVAGPVLRLSTR